MDWFWHPLPDPGRPPAAMQKTHPHAAVEFAYGIDFEQAPERIVVRTGADAPVILSLNDRILWLDPAEGSVGEATLLPAEDECSFLFSAIVHAPGTNTAPAPGRFALEAEFLFADGARQRVALGPSWHVRLRPDFIDDDHYNGRLDNDLWMSPVPVSAPPAPQSVARLHEMSRFDPVRNAEIVLPGGAWLSFDAPFNTARDAFAEVEANVPCELVLQSYRTDSDHPFEEQSAVLDPGAGCGVFRPLRPQTFAGCLCTLRSFVPDLPVTVRIRALARA